MNGDEDDGNSAADEESLSDNETGDSAAEVLEALETYTRCLLDLGPLAQKLCASEPI